MSLSVDDIVRVSASITPQGLLRREFGITLFLTTDTTLSTGAGRVSVNAQFSDVSGVFDESTEPYEAANIYFQQAPFPKNLIIARWINADAPAIVRGGRVGSLAAITAVNDGSLQINAENFTGIDFTSDASFADVAATLQTALRAGSDVNLNTAVVTFDVINQRFEITTGTTVGATATLTIASAGGSGTAVEGLLSLDADSNAVVFQQGANEETVEDALEAILALNDQWYFITLDNTLNDTQTVNDVSAWAAPRAFLFSAESNGASVLTTGETSSTFAELAALDPQRTFGTWSATEDYKSVSIAGRFSSVNFSARNSIITGKFKSLPGTLADRLTPTQQTELERKLVNYYAPFSGDNIYAEGYTFAPSVFIDVRYGLDWFVNAVQVEVYNLLRQNPTKVPQTNAGITAIKNVIEDVCASAVRNGLVAPGQLSAALTLDVQQTTGNNEFDGFLTDGFLVYPNPLSEQSQSDRNQRLAPPFRIWLKGAGAIHFVDIEITFEN